MPRRADHTLNDYRRKRDFVTTPEPAGTVGPSLSGNLFVIHEHAARRLHYDLRLELGGVLKSWAVPKGPSLNPAEKRLAVRVEDHPLDYASFEGSIPAGEYGAGTVMVWDTGTWEPLGEAAADPAAALEAGKLKFRLRGNKLRGGWMLVRLRPRPGRESTDEWLLFKERDREAATGERDITARQPLSALSGRSLQQIAAAAPPGDRSGDDRPDRRPLQAVARFKRERSHPAKAGDGQLRLARAPDAGALPAARRAPLPARPAPQLATLAAAAPDGEDWLHEVKLDGYRILCRLEDGAARFFTRSGADWTARFPLLAEAVSQIPARQAVVDGEVVFVDEDGRTSFSRLAAALRGDDPQGRIVYYIFDLLYLDGYDLTPAPLHRRKAALQELLAGLPAGARVRFVEHLEGRGSEFFRQTCAFSLEGAVSKRRSAPYRPGRGPDWRKSKCVSRQEFVIGGFTERAGTHGDLGALLLGVMAGDGGRLHFAGRVGTGWDHATARDLRVRLDALRTEGSPFADGPPERSLTGVRWVLPHLVAEVAFRSWDTERGALRHASFKGLRADKPAGQVAAEVAPRSPQGGGRGIQVGGVTISSPQRLQYPDAGITKLAVARYYEAVADLILPHLSRRPLTLVRCPAGAAGHCFFQKHATTMLSENVLRVPIAEGAGEAVSLAIDSTAGLLALVQAGVLEMHTWGARLDRLERPDRLCFDLDPDPSLPFSAVVAAATLVRDLLADLGLRSFVKTTGGKGLHVLVPIEPTRSWDEVKAFSRALADTIVRAAPERYVGTMALSKRRGKVFIDTFRNTRGATFVSAYSTRGRPDATVSVPLRWEELKPGLRGDRYTIGGMLRRMAALRSDPWDGFHEFHQEITPAAMERALRAAARRP